MFAQNIHKPPKLYGAGGKYGGGGYGLGSEPIKPEPSALEQLAAVAPEAAIVKTLQSVKRLQLIKLCKKLGIDTYNREDAFMRKLIAKHLSKL